MHLLCERVTRGVLDYGTSPTLHDDSTLSRLKSLVAPAHPVARYLHSPVELAHALDLWMLSDSPLEWRGTRINGPTLSLNTAIAVGSDPLRLCARLHGQCEIHAFVEGVDRRWLADVVDEGVSSGVLRPQRSTFYESWPAIAALLRVDQRSPVVTSYSVTDGFPGPHVLAPSGHRVVEEDHDRFSSMSVETQWEACMSALRQSSAGLRMHPGEWAHYRFGRGLTALDLLADDWRPRLDACVAPPEAS